MITSQQRSLTGIRATGNVHIGNYLGMIRPALRRQEQYQCLYFIADMHSLTTNREPQKLSAATFDLVATWLALGFDTTKHLLYRQSDIGLVAELAWYLSCCTGMGLLEKAHAYKDALAQSKELNHGVFAYPVLMAADILLYDADVVPVGKDQKQHVEMARDMAGSFNALFGEGVIKLPEPMVEESVMAIPGLDGRKMSKSYNNEIPLWASEKELRKLIMSIKTDSTPLEQPKQLRGSLIGDLFVHFASADQLKSLEQRLAAGGLGWGHAKEELFGVVNEHLKESRKRYIELRADEQGLSKALEDGRRKACEIALPVLDRVRKAIGFSSCPFRPS